MPQVPTNATPNKTATPVKAAAQISGKPLLVPPEEQFWVRYSPHNEFSLSGATSVALHIIGLGLLILLAWLFFKQPMVPDDSPQLDSVSVADYAPQARVGKAGGGGTEGDPDAPKENVDDVPRNENPNEGNNAAGPGLEDPKDAPMVDIGPSKDGTRTIVSGSAPNDLDDIGKKAFTVLAQRKPTPKRYGTGSGDGKDGGKDKGNDKGFGAGEKGDPEVRRAKRQLRWRVVFNQNSNGDDYLDKLHALGAILVVAELKAGPDGKPAMNNRGQAILRYRLVIRDLGKQPAKPTEEDVSKIEGIFWIDDKPDSVGALADALGIKRPPLFACFFKRKVEDDLRRLEKAKFSGNEDLIFESHFRVVEAADGPYKGKSKTYKLVCDRVTRK